MKRKEMLTGFPLPGALTEVSCSGDLLIGVSGGVDSMVLWNLLEEQYGGRLVVCHVNHGLRGADSDGDEAFVCEEAGKRGVRFVSARGDVAARARQEKASMELAARDFRYACFTEWAREFHSSVLFLAHHANDQAETVLFNLCRGSAGLASIKGVGERLGMKLIRPLLGVPRRAILTYAEARGLEWREDRTNSQPVAVRNELRIEVIPALERITGRDVVTKIAQSARLAAEKDEALQQAVELLNLLDPQGRLYLPGLEKLERALRRVAIHWFLKRENVSGLSEAMVNAAEGLLEAGAPAKVMLPGGDCLRRREKRLFVERLSGK